MLSYYKHEQVNFNNWDICLGKSPDGLIYGLSWYLNIISPGWSAIVEEVNGEYVAVMPLPSTNKFGLRYIRKPIFAQQLGVFGLQPWSPAKWQQAMNILSKYFRLVSRYEFNTSNEKHIPAAVREFSRKKLSTQYLALNIGYQAIYDGYNENRKRQIKKAHNSKLLTQESDNIELMINIFDKNTAARIYGFVGEGYTYRILRSLYQEAKARNMASLYEVINGAGEIVAMALLFNYNGKMIYLFNATTIFGRNHGAISFLLDWVFKKYANQEIYFDFESPEEESIVRFYASFGAVKVPFTSVAMNDLPVPVQWLKTIRTRIVRYFTT